MLGISYQHVRKVSLDAGITGGLLNQMDVELEPITVDVGPVQPKAASSWENQPTSSASTAGRSTYDARI
jgi:hypothetical protein